MLVADADHAPVVVALVVDAFSSTGGLDELQQRLLDDLAGLLWGLDAATVPPLTDDMVAGADADTRSQAVHLMAVLELMEHPLRPEVARAVLAATDGLGVDRGMLVDARRLADGHIAAMYLDLQRHSWYRRVTVQQSLHGRLVELARSKVAYLGLVPDPALARRWRALGDCAPGTWGRGVHDFYTEHGFPFPGERHGIYELGARHDWVHVLTGYGTDAEGELDVFAFIAATMPGDQGLALLGITLGLFQNGAIHHVGGRRIDNAAVDTINDVTVVDRWARAFWHGTQCTVDIMNDVDLFAWADTDLAEVRRQFSVATD